MFANSSVRENFANKVRTVRVQGANNSRTTTVRGSRSVRERFAKKVHVIPGGTVFFGIIYKEELMSSLRKQGVYASGRKLANSLFFRAYARLT